MGLRFHGLRLGRETPLPAAPGVVPVDPAIVYREAFSAAARLRVLSARYFSPRSCMHHYPSMAEGNYREYLQRDPVRVKKYFYVLRPVLACRWIEMHGTTPPSVSTPRILTME